MQELLLGISGSETLLLLGVMPGFLTGLWVPYFTKFDAKTAGFHCDDVCGVHYISNTQLADGYAERCSVCSSANEECVNFSSGHNKNIGYPIPMFSVMDEVPDTPGGTSDLVFTRFHVLENADPTHRKVKVANATSLGIGSWH